MPAPLPPPLSALIEQAHQLAASGNPGAAERCFEQVRQRDPDNLQALNFIALCHSARGNHHDATRLLQRALALAPDDVGTHKNLAVSLIQQQQYDAAEPLLRAALALDPGFFVARLYLGWVQEQQRRPHLALTTYFLAVNAAQKQGNWLSDDSTPPGLRPRVLHAMKFLAHGRHDVLHRLLAPLHAQHGAQALRRVDKAVDGYLGRMRLQTADPLQRPSFLYFPDLPATPYLDRSLFPWYEALEDQTDPLREELLSVLDERALLQPFLGDAANAGGQSYLAGEAGATARWDGFFFHRHGRRYDDNCARCPRTAAALQATTLVQIPGHAPEALYSVLGPGSHIRPHTGVTNTRIVTHLPLLVPEHCALRVAGQTHAWQTGRCISFDDTWEHEAWNRGTQTRVVLLFDVWNPHLTDVERDAVSQLVTAIAELNGAQVLAE